MKRLKQRTALLFLAGLLLNTGAAAQHSMHHTYDPATVETLRGVVARVDSMAMQDHTGIHLLLKTDEESVEVHLGPDWFLLNQDEQILVGDRIEVTGSRIDIGGAPALIAREIVKGDQRLVLRDEQGYPVWRGWRRNGPADGR